MKAFEAEQLLRWQIAPLATLSVSDADKIQELAKDLYYWPLLLNLVRGQLFIHCTARKQSPSIAILNVQQKLQGKGLTAFDPKHIKKENAVKASINASLELLSDNEKYILFHVVTGIGIGSCVLKGYVFKLSKVSSEEFEKLTNDLWSHGLISFEIVTLPPEAIDIPSIEIHEIIAQYIIEEMPYEYYIFLSEVSIEDSNDYFFSVLEDEAGDRDFTIALIEVFMFPYLIRRLAVSTRAVQIKFSVALDSLIESYNDVLKTSSLKKYFRNKHSLSKIYGSVKDNCRTIQSMLGDKRYDEAVAWVAEYCNNHAYKVQTESIETLKSNECKHNTELVKLINNTIGASIKSTMAINGMKTILISLIHFHELLSEMIKAKATKKDQ